jgi:TfoX/Sxy family transcriptional regulator of competence genes
MDKLIQSQQQRLNDVDKHDVEVADDLLKATSTSYKRLVTSINQLIIDYHDTDIILPSQKPKKRDLQRLNSLIEELSRKLSKDGKKRLKGYLAISSLNMQFYIQALVGVQNLLLHEQYAEVNKKALHQDFDDELKFQKKQVKLPPKKVKKVADQKEAIIDYPEHEERIWSNHDLIVAGISIALLKMLRNQRRNELVAQMLPQYKFRRSIHGGDYVPIKHVGKELPINSYYQSEQYVEEQNYRTKSSNIIRETALKTFELSFATRVKVINEFNPCPECKRFVGEVYPINEAPELPFHENCRCRLAHVDDDLKPTDYVENKELDLNERELRALKNYISLESYKINEKLRNGENLKGFHLHMVDDLDDALKKMPRYHGDLSRSLNFMDENSLREFLSNHKPGDIVKYPAYTSTTSEIYDDSDQLRLTIKNSSHGRDLRRYNNNEMEILYERGSRFKIISNYLQDGKPTIEMEELGRD